MLIWPEAASLHAAEQRVVAAGIESRAIFDILPIRNRDTDLVEWEQRDNFGGLQLARGYNNEFQKRTSAGVKKFYYRPGIYGESYEIDELKLARARRMATRDAKATAADLIAPLMMEAVTRRLNRIEYCGWQLLLNGNLMVANGAGQVVHVAQYKPLTYTAPVLWSSTATSKPLQCFRDIQQQGPPNGCDFGSGATAYMNRYTFNLMISCTNIDDLAGKRTDGLATVMGFDETNKVLLKEGLPNIKIYDEGYWPDGVDANDPAQFVRWIANGKVIVEGKRPTGTKAGEYSMTINPNNPGSAPGVFQKVIDYSTVPGARPPYGVELFDGHNGGPRTEYPGSLMVMSVL